MAKKATTSDVAKLAGVSQSAVSKILSLNPDASFSEQTVEKVQAAAQQLGYVPRSRRVAEQPRGAARCIGLLCPTVTNPYYAVIVQAVEQVAFRAGYRVLVCNTYRDVALEEEYLASLWEMGVEGVIYAFLPNAPRHASELAKQLPLVVIGDKSDEVGIDTLELDSHKSGVMLAEYLIELGHRDIAFLSTTLNKFNPPRTRRLQGVEETMHRHGLSKRLHVLSQEVTLQSELDYMNNEYDIGYALTQQVLAAAPQITALVGVNDMVAYGILDALDHAGHSVPEQYSVCGFDDNFPSAFSRISLTTVDHHMVYKGNNAFDILMKKINNKKDFRYEADRVVRVEYTPNLVVRGSTAPPRSE